MSERLCGNDTEKLEKRGRSIAAMGLVARAGERFVVAEPKERGKAKAFAVWRNQKGKVVCNCDDFVTIFDADPSTAFRCEHIFAVKFALQEKNVKESMPGDPAPKPDLRKTVEADTIIGTDKANGPSYSTVAFQLPAGQDWLFFVRQERDETTRTHSFYFDFNESHFEGFSDEDYRTYWSKMLEALEKTKQHISDKYRLNPGPEPGDIPNPIAGSLSDLVTAKQLRMIRALCRELGIDEEAECRAVYQAGTQEISKKAASAFIQHLQDIQRKRG